MLILDGKKSAQIRIQGFKKRVANITKKLGRSPNLLAVLVGEDPASKIYVDHKKKQCSKVGIQSTVIGLSEKITQVELISEIDKFNKNNCIDGILVQLPLPDHLLSFDPSNYILDQKDVDGLTAKNMGLMVKGRAFAEPCTPRGIIELLKYYHIELRGKRAAVLGRSQIVGWPMAWMLTRENATVTVCHSRTKDLKPILKESDLVVVAVGKPHFLNKNFFKKRAVVIDVGIHRLHSGKLIGDVDTQGFKEKNISYSPVPGGVGPMTVNQLVGNLIDLVTLKV